MPVIIDLSGPIYTALVGTSDELDGLAMYEGALAVFTYRPIPDDCSYPLIIAAGDVTHGDQDFIDAPLGVIVRDIAVYGKKRGKDPEPYRTVERIALNVRDLFHRKRGSLIIPGWNVVDIRCTGPIVAPVDDDHTIGRLVTMTVRLSQ